MNEFEKIRAWNTLKTQINKIYDYKTRQMYHRAFLARAIDSYGFNPENPAYGQKNSPSVDLDDWEKEFVEDINDTIVFGIDVRKEKRKQTFKESHARMLQFITQGGKLSDIPNDVCTDTIKNLYYDCLIEYGNNLLEQVDLITKG